jgi:pterin-4a-carbinolamine dehydratase
MSKTFEELKAIAEKYDMRIVDQGVIKLYKSDITPIQRALSGLNDIMELAYTTAEHHPYWGMLYNSIEIVRRLLEKWDDELDDEDIDELEWRIEEIRNMLSRFKQ